MTIRRFVSLFSLVLVVGVLGSLTGCAFGAPAEPFRVLSGSENRTLEPLIEQFNRQERENVQLDYKGSVDIMLELEQGGSLPYDAVWPANSLWIALGDTHNVVRNQESIMRSPVVLGVKRSVAQQLGWVGHDVRVNEILQAAEQGRIRSMMTSATQSNSGAAAYLGYLYAFAGNPPVLTAEHLRQPEVRE